MNKSVFAGLVEAALAIVVIASMVATLDMLATKEVMADRTPDQPREHMSEQEKTMEPVMTICVMPLECS